MPDWRPQAEICRAYCLDPGRLAKDREEGRGLPCIRRGNRVLIDREAIDDLLRRQTQVLMGGIPRRT
jgi:hypothetical protein